METGDPESEETGAIRNEDNVVRFPRDWIGPREELVPVGPFAGAGVADLGLDGALPPTADAFWSEESAALHDAVQAPPVEAPGHWASPADAAGIGRARARARAAGIRCRQVLASRRARWALLGLAVTSLAVMATIGATQGPGTSSTHHSVASHVPSGASASAPRSTTEPTTAAAARTGLRAPVTTVLHRATGGLARAGSRHAHARAHPRRVTAARVTNRSPAVVRSSPPPAATYTAPPAPATTTSGAGISPPTGSAPTSTSAGATSASQPHFGQNGSLAPGSSPDS